MALLPVNDDALPCDATLRAAMAGLKPSAPIVIMIHGFRFAPADPGHDPHRHILAQRPDPSCRKAVSWPRHLGVTGGLGLAIGFGWTARGTIWQAHARAAQAGLRLARLIAALNRIAPDRPVHLFAHSLGARVALTALPRLQPGSVDRIILLAAAAFQPEAARMMASPAGRTTEVINVRGRENMLFDLLLRAALPRRGPTLGRGLPDVPNWLDLSLDRDDCLAVLARLGHRIRPGRAMICHWSGYLRPGAFGLYRSLLFYPAATPLLHLRTLLAPPKRPARFRINLVPLPFRRQTPF